ncbi:MAG: cysteine--tRNA ligase, partial [Candidatus Margulisiibacteriota bacterium]
YGELAKLDVKGLKEGIRVEKNPEKKNPTDFALWKFAEKGVRQMEWDSPWAPPGNRGKVMGFPGWHIECSAMSMKYFGPTFDIHCGGVDHIPIHHTNEIAQSEAANGKKFVNYWLHGEFLLTDKEKMAKSKGGFLTLEKLVEKGFSPMDYRFFILNANYRTKLGFSFEKLEKAKKELKGIRKKIAILKSEPIKSDDKREVLQALNDDLDTSKAISLLQRKNNRNLWLMFDKVLGLNLGKKSEVGENVKKLLKDREVAREKKDFKKSDEIREELKKRGIEVEDTKDGQKWVEVS